MIKSLELKNFEGYDHLFIDFSTGVNAIVGDTGKGKSSIVRAIIWIATNKPSYKELISHGAKFIEGILTLDDDTRIRRYRDNADNLYQINDEEPFRSFSQSVPEDIKKILNVESINFHEQFDAPFFLSSSSGEIARQLNKIVGLDDIDISVSNITKRIKSEEQSLKNEQSNIKTFTENLESFNWIPDAESELIKLENLDQEIRDILIKKENIRHILEHIEQVHKELNEISKITIYKDKVDFLIKVNKEIDEDIDFTNDVTDICNNIKQLETEIDNIKQVIKYEEEVDSLISLYEEIKEKRKKYGEILTITDDIIQLEVGIVKIKMEREELQKEYDELMPEICPLCEKPL